MGIEMSEWNEWFDDYRTKAFVKGLMVEVESSDGLRNMADFADYRFNEGIKCGLEEAAFRAQKDRNENENTKTSG